MLSSNSFADPLGTCAHSACRTFVHESTKTLTHVVWDRATRKAAVIDPVLDFEASSGAVATTSLDAVLGCLARYALQLEWILETHVHADHVSGADRLRALVGGRVGTGAHVRTVQATVRAQYGTTPSDADDGAFDHLFDDGETFRIGSLEATVLHVPGHTPADVAYRIRDTVFVGDALFMPDVGSGRTDFPGGDARQSYRSIRRLLALPPHTVIHVGHDYPPPHRDVAWRATVADHRASNIHVHDGIGEDAFVAMRTARDATLAPPVLLRPSLMANVYAGRLPT